MEGEDHVKCHMKVFVLFNHFWCAIVGILVSKTKNADDGLVVSIKQSACALDQALVGSIER